MLKINKTSINIQFYSKNKRKPFTNNEAKNTINKTKKKGFTLCLRQV